MPDSPVAAPSGPSLVTAARASSLGRQSWICRRLAPPVASGLGSASAS